MKKTLQTCTVILGLMATGSMTSLAEEETEGKKPPRAERGERGEGERRGQRRGGPRQIPKEMLEKFDKNGDGKLDEDERKEAMSARRAEFIKKYEAERRSKPSSTPQGEPVMDSSHCFQTVNRNGIAQNA